MLRPSWSYEICNFEQNLVCGRRFAIEDLGDISTDHETDHVVVGDFLLGQITCIFPISQNGDAICKLDHFAESMGNVNNAHTSFAQVLDDFEKSFGLATGKATRRLIHDEDFCFG